MDAYICWKRPVQQKQLSAVMIFTEHVLSKEISQAIAEVKLCEKLRRRSVTPVWDQKTKRNKFFCAIKKV